MKNLYFCFVLLMVFINSWGQNSIKDTLYFKLNSSYIEVKKNYEGVHAFIFKNEKFVTSAFGKIVKEDLFFFTQSDFPPIKYKLKPYKTYRLKKYLRKNKKIFIEKSTKKLDAYRIMKYFDKYIVFFKKDCHFIKVRVHTSLGE